jgi:hypothetical protein
LSWKAGNEPSGRALACMCKILGLIPRTEKKKEWRLSYRLFLFSELPTSLLSFSIRALNSSCTIHWTLPLVTLCICSLVSRYLFIYSFILFLAISFIPRPKCFLFICLLFLVLGIEFRGLCMLSRCSITELYC